VLGALVEYFTLKRALEVHGALDAAARKRIADALAIGRQKADAAEALWSNGHAAEALRLAVAALEATVAALPAYAEGMKLGPRPVAEGDSERPAEAKADVGEGEPDEMGDEAALRRAALHARGLDPRRIATVEAALEAAGKCALPTLDAEVSPSHAELFQQVVAARHLVERVLRTAGMDRKELRFARAVRITTAGIVGVLAVAAVWFATWTPPGVRAEASAVWANAPAFGAETVIDGRPDTYWLLPDGQPGWVEARISPPRRIEHVRVLNSHNPPHEDRATRDYRIELYSGSELVRTIEGSFEFSTSPQPVEHAVGADGIDRIRFVVLSHHRIGGGLAELSWD
jgi:hypothetical protein